MANQEQSREELEREVQELRDRLEVAEETLLAITRGEVDALVVCGPQGEQVYTLQGADYSYRLFVEEMKEGAATLNSEGILLYCNNRLASLVKNPLEKLIGSDLKQYIAPREQSMFQVLLQQAQVGVGKGELSLLATDGTEIPVHLSISSFNMHEVKVSCVIITDLTEQKRNEEIVAAERLARSILEQAAEAIVVCDENGQIIRASQAAHQLCKENPIFQLFDSVLPLQFSQPKGTGKTQKSLVKGQWFSVATVLDGESFQGVEVLFGRKDGQKFNLLLSARSLFNPESHLKGCIVTLTDITHRKQAEEALKQLNETLESRVIERTAELDRVNRLLKRELAERKQAEEQREQLLQQIEYERAHLEAVLRQMPAAILIAEAPSGKVTLYNDKVESVFGHSTPASLRLEDLSRYGAIHPDGRPYAAQEYPIARSLLTGEVVINEDMHYLRGDGSHAILAIYSSPIHNAQGQIIASVEAAFDITDRKLAEKELKLQAVIARNMAEGICLIRVADTVIVYANPKFERMFGYEPGELNGKHASIVNYEDEYISAEEVNRAIRCEVMQHGEATYEVHNVKKDGTPFWCRATTAIFDHPEYGTVLVGVQQDITEYKLAEERIKASLKEKEVLLKEIHHRVKNNLQIIDSLLQMQCRRTQDRQAAAILIDSQNRIASIALVHEKLYRSEDLAKIDFAQYVPDLTTHLFESYNISSEAVTLNIKVDDISLEIDTAIPCGFIINELVSNSLKYAFPENRQGKIDVEVYASNDYNITLIVRDNGIGIPEEFDIETTQSLGLTLVQVLVEQLEGTIEIVRRQGTEFRMTFPRDST